MTVTLNEPAYRYARQLMEDGCYVLDDRDEWSEHQASTQRENEFIERHGIGEYARWHLGIDDEMPEERKARYKFPYGDFESIHRCGVLAADARARQRQYHDIETAAAHLHGSLDALRSPTHH